MVGPLSYLPMFLILLIMPCQHSSIRRVRLGRYHKDDNAKLNAGERFLVGYLMAYLIWCEVAILYHVFTVQCLPYEIHTMPGESGRSSYFYRYLSFIPLSSLSLSSSLESGQERYEVCCEKYYCIQVPRTNTPYQARPWASALPAYQGTPVHQNFPTSGSNSLPSTPRGFPWSAVGGLETEICQEPHARRTLRLKNGYRNLP